MRNALLLILSAGLMLLAFSQPTLAYPRTVLAEDFTNWG